MFNSNDFNLMLFMFAVLGYMGFRAVEWMVGFLWAHLSWGWS